MLKQYVVTFATKNGLNWSYGTVYFQCDKLTKPLLENVRRDYCTKTAAEFGDSAIVMLSQID